MFFDSIVFATDRQNYELSVFVANSKLMEIEFDIFCHTIGIRSIKISIASILYTFAVLLLCLYFLMN